MVGGRRRCPECAELVRREARRCRYCGAELEPFAASETGGGAVLAVALGNLTGLGLGYFALERGGRALLACLGTVAVLGVAWATAGSGPLLQLLPVVGWLALCALDGVRIARRGRLPVRGKRVLTAAAATVLALALGAVLAQRSLVSDAYADGLALHKSDHCQQASERYSSAAKYKLAFSGRVRDAERGREECEELLNADGLDKGRREAVTAYERFLARHPASVLRQPVRERAAAAHVAVGKSELDGTADGLLDAMRAFQSALSAYPDTRGAASAGRAAVQAWNQLRSDACEGLKGADELAVEDELSTPEITEVVVQSGREIPALLIGCARSERKAGAFELAIGDYERFLREYRGHPAGARVRTELIATRVAFYTHGAKKPNLPPPSVSGGAPTGTVEIAITNASPEQLELLFSGAAAARSVIIPACSGCPKFRAGASAESSCNSGPSRTIRIPPGGYDTVARSPSDDAVTPFVGKWNLQSGYRYSDCYFIRTHVLP